MTTPERLRRRQIRNDIFTAAVALSMVVFTIVFLALDAKDDRCFRAYIANDSETAQTRSKLVERESEALRTVIRTAGSATSREEFEGAIRAYEAELRKIDKQREENPVVPFDPDRC